MKIKMKVFMDSTINIPRSSELSELLDELRTKFTYSNPKYNKLKKMSFYVGNIPQYISTWSHKDHDIYGPCLSLPRGNIYKIKSVFKKYNIDIDIVDERLSLDSITGYTNNVVLRDDQIKLVNAMYKEETCLIRSPPGSGKTECGLKLAEYILKNSGPVLIIVWDSDLLEQWIIRTMERFSIDRKDIGVISGSKKVIKPITIGMQQTLKNNINKYKNLFGGIICDEVQRFAANTYMNVVNELPAKYRIGISADERRNDRMEFLIYDNFGDVAEEISRNKLIKQGSLHDVAIRIIPTNYNYVITDGVKEYQWKDIPIETKCKYMGDMVKDLLTDEYRNEIIWKFIKPSFDCGHKILIMTIRRFHAVYWNDFIKSKGYSCGLMIGSKKNMDEFIETKNGLLSDKIQAGIGTVHKLGQSIDIPKWNRGFLLSPSSNNKQNLEQMIGRLRRTAPNKKDAICYYFCDQLLHPYAINQVSKLYPNTFVYDDGKFINTYKYSKNTRRRNGI